jgi:hypothetical protein
MLSLEWLIAPSKESVAILEHEQIWSQKILLREKIFGEGNARQNMLFAQACIIRERRLWSRSRRLLFAIEEHEPRVQGNGHMGRLWASKIASARKVLHLEPRLQRLARGTKSLSWRN